MKKFFRNNGLSIVVLLIFSGCLVAQIFTGFRVHNSELKEKGAAPIGLSNYLHSGHFIETTFENWESEFLQMGMFVVLSAFLYQKGSSESKDPDEETKETSAVKNKEAVPWPVRKGGFVLLLYKYSLSIVFALLFLLSFALHFYGSLQDYNEEQLLDGNAGSGAIAYLTNTRFWFESFQNWQSEFLAVFSVVVLSIFLRHKGSPQSKKITDPDSKTGE